MTTRFAIKNRHGLNIVGDVTEAEDRARLVFLQHGLGGHRRRPLLVALAEFYRSRGYAVCAFDATKSLGESEGELCDVTLTSHAQDLCDVIAWARGQSWFVAPFALAGHSLGAASCLLYACDRPDDVNELSLFSAVTGYGDYAYAHEKYRAADWAQMQAGRYEKADALTGRKGVLNAAYLKDMKTHDIGGCAARLRMPVAMFAAANDKTTPVECQRKFFDSLPDAVRASSTFVVCPEAEHSFLSESSRQKLLNLMSGSGRCRQ